MTETRIPTPYATPSALGVKPDARLPGRVPDPGLRLDVRRPAAHGGRAPASSRRNARLLDFAGDNFFILFIAQLAIVVGDLRRDQPDQRRRRARPVLRLRRLARASRSG